MLVTSILPFVVMFSLPFYNALCLLSKFKSIVTILSVLVLLATLTYSGSTAFVIIIYLNTNGIIIAHRP